MSRVCLFIDLLFVNEGIDKQILFGGHGSEALSKSGFGLPLVLLPPCDHVSNHLREQIENFRSRAVF